MRINTAFADLQWREYVGTMGLGLVSFLLPYKEDSGGLFPHYPNFKKAIVVNNGFHGHRFGWFDRRVLGWSASIRNTVGGTGRNHLLLLDIGFKDKDLGRQFTYTAQTPLGSHGTVLLDPKGRIVPHIEWNAGCRVRVLCFDQSKKNSIRWNSECPVMGLQFLDGSCALPDWYLSLWDIAQRP